MKIGETLKMLMLTAGSHSDMTGTQKKEWVLNRLKEMMDFDDALEELIIGIIDLIIDVEKKRIIINPVLKRGLFSCCS
jgi:hypothetical protein